jgi:hypothetical protein
VDFQEKISGTFSLYEHVSYLLVGGVAVLLALGASRILGYGSLEAIFPVYIWLLGAYVIGHFAQGVSNLYSKLGLHKETKTDFTEKEKGVLTHAAKFYKADKDNYGFVWGLCYLDALTSPLGSHIERFIAYYGFYRGLFAVFLSFGLVFGGLFIAALLGAPYSAQMLAVSAALCIAMGFTFKMRAARFWQYGRTKVLQSFILKHNERTAD